MMKKRHKLKSIIRVWILPILALVLAVLGSVIYTVGLFDNPRRLIAFITILVFSYLLYYVSKPRN